MVVNIHEAKTKLSALLNRLAAGEEIIIAKAGRAIARLVPYREEGAKRVSGRYRGQGYIAEDFDAPMRDVEDSFYS